MISSYPCVHRCLYHGEPLDQLRVSRLNARRTAPGWATQACAPAPKKALRVEGVRYRRKSRGKQVVSLWAGDYWKCEHGKKECAAGRLINNLAHCNANAEPGTR